MGGFCDVDEISASADTYFFPPLGKSGRSKSRSDMCSGTLKESLAREKWTWTTRELRPRTLAQASLPPLGSSANKWKQDTGQSE